MPITNQQRLTFAPATHGKERIGELHHLEAAAVQRCVRASDHGLEVQGIKGCVVERNALDGPACAVKCGVVEQHSLRASGPSKRVQSSTYTRESLGVGRQRRAVVDAPHGLDQDNELIARGNRDLDGLWSHAIVLAHECAADEDLRTSASYIYEAQTQEQEPEHGRQRW